MNLRHSIVVLIAFTTFAFPSVAADNASGAANESSIPLIVLDNVPLVDAIKNLARQANLNYILDPRVASLKTTVSGRWTNTSPHAALNGLLQKHDLTNVVNSSTSVARIAPATGLMTGVSTNQAGTNAGAIIPLLAVDDVPLPEVIENLIAAAKLNIIIDPKAKATPAFARPERVSFRWERITARQALMALLDNYDLVLVEVPSSPSARITPKNGSSKTP